MNFKRNRNLNIGVFNSLVFHLLILTESRFPMAMDFKTKNHLRGTTFLGYVVTQEKLVLF